MTSRTIIADLATESQGHFPCICTKLVVSRKKVKINYAHTGHTLGYFYYRLSFKALKRPTYKEQDIHVSRCLPWSCTHGASASVANLKINLCFEILRLYSLCIPSKQSHQQMVTSSTKVPTQQLLIAFQGPRSRMYHVILSHLL